MRACAEREGCASTSSLPRESEGQVARVRGTRGWRIDEFLASESLRGRLRAAAIHPEIMGSDHCPVSLEIE